MKTKIMPLFIIGVLMLSFMAVGVLAQSPDSSSQSSNAVSISDLAVSSSDISSLATSDEDVDSSSGIFRDRMMSWFAFSKERKAEIKMRIAKKRMFEVGEKAMKNPKKAKELAKEYENSLNDALDNFDQIAVDGDKKEVINALKRTVIIKFKLENHKEKSSEIHERILENKADDMTSEQMDHLEEVFSTISDHIDSSIERVEQTQENLKARLIALGVDESLIDKRIEAFENVLASKRQDRENHMGDILKKMRQHRAQIRNHFMNGSDNSTMSSMMSGQGSNSNENGQDSDENGQNSDEDNQGSNNSIHLN